MVLELQYIMIETCKLLEKGTIRNLKTLHGSGCRLESKKADSPREIKGRKIVIYPKNRFEGSDFHPWFQEQENLL